MSGLFGGGKTNADTKPSYTGLQVQTSAAGLPIPLLWGTQRVAPNLIWYDDFTSKAVASDTGGGKGGGAQSTTQVYSCAVAMGLCEGEIAGIGRVWADKTDTSLAKLNLTLFTGTADQAPFASLYTQHTDQALGYPYTAYVASPSYDLGSSASLPNHNFEVQSDAVSRTGPSAFDANPADILVDFLTNERYGVGLPADRIGDLGAWRSYCAAAGLLMSPLLAQQEAASDIVNRWAQLTNTLIYWSGDQVRALPLGDQPLTGNGVTFTPDLTPVYDLTDDDFIAGAGDDPVTLSRSDPADAINTAKVEYKDRDNSYQTATAEVRDLAAIDAYGLRTGDPVQAHEICSAATASAIATLILQRQLYVRNTYQFKLAWTFALLEPGDIVTLTDAALGLAKFPVRITQIDEDEDGLLTFTAEELPAGIGTATLYPTPVTSNTPLNTGVDPGDLADPVIFEPSPGLSGGVQQVWIGACGLSPNWGGCSVWVSADDLTYQRVGQITAPARLGTLGQDLTAGAADAYVSLATSRLKLAGGSAADAAAGRTLSLLGAEMVAYGPATLTGSAAYHLADLNRGLYGTGAVDHPAGTPFLRLDEAVFKYDLPAAYIGQTLYIKLTSFNIFQAAERSLAEVNAYLYSPVGAVGALPAPTGLTLAVENAVLADGTVQLGIRARWTPADAGMSTDTILRWGVAGSGGVTDWQQVKVPAGSTDTLLMPVTQAVTYTVQAASGIGTDVRSAWGPAVSIEVGGVLGGASVTHLELYGQGLDTEFVGRDIHLVWQGNFPATSASLGNQPYGAGSGYVNPYFQAYAVTVIEPDSGAVLRTDLVTTEEYFYLFDSMNAKDAGGPHRRLTFSVTIRDKLGGESKAATLTVNNPAPPAVAAQVRQGVGTIVVDIPVVTDRDLAGYIVWISQTQGFDPTATEPAYQGLLNLLVLPEALGSYYVRAAAYDAFGTSGLNIAGEIPIKVEDIVLDVTPPAVPTGLALTSSTSITPAGDALTVLKATWDASPSANFASFDVAIEQGTGSEIVFTTTAPAYQWTVSAATAYSVRVRARSKSDIASDYSAAVSLTTAGDTVPPGACSGLTVLPGLRAPYLSWVNPSDADLAAIEIWASTTNDRAAAVKVASVMSTAFTHTGLPASQTRYYWVRAVDTSGNIGPWFPSSGTAGVSGTVAQAVAADFSPGSLNYTAFASGLSPVGVVGSLPAVSGYTGPSVVLLTTDAKLYRLSGGAWTRATDGADILSNSITSGAITAGAIKTAQLDAGAITTEKIAAGAITAATIAANTITASQIATGTITATQIAAQTLTGNLFAPSTSLPATITVGTTGVSIGTVKDTADTAQATANDAQSKANNPAAQVNANSTLIAPGKVQLTGGTTLTNWLYGGDNTQINGGAIAANTITANKLTIGNRGLAVEGLGFTADPTTNTVSWVGGSVTYTDNNGATQVAGISGGSATWTGQLLYLYWVQGANAISATSDASVAMGGNAVVFATYNSNTWLNATYGRTTIDGANIRTGTITASLISAAGLATSVITSGTFDAVRIPSLDAGKITTGTLGASVVYAGTITADQIRGGSISGQIIYATDNGQPSTSGLTINGPNRNIWVADGNRGRCLMGKNVSDYGFWSWDSSGRLLFDSNDLGVGVASGVASVSAYQDGSSVTASTKGAWTTITSVPAFQVRGNPCDIKVTFSASVAITGSGGNHAYGVKVQVLRTNTRTGATSTIGLNLTASPYQGFASDGAYSDPNLDTYTYALQAWRPADIVGGGDSGGTIVYDAWQFSGVTMQVRWFR
ncbi:phage tail protein [Nitrospirillum sp. BR 11164]|uniref:phage tail protein n=1 Tax=Nitrospirillum sp. BR 11164 TaxID=3104324 RepID=UPI002B001F6B|nr:phage tail protein [Nitrospirillum sp. BR 11164]MEA1651845.1 phage tail protein [Nitrospirillum sp. BR 11164]